MKKTKSLIAAFTFVLLLIFLSGCPMSSEPEVYSVTFDTDGGTTVSAQSVEENEKATRPADPTKDGYVFDNWYAEDTFETVWDFDTSITEDTTLYAKWTADSSSDSASDSDSDSDSYTVTFDSQGASTDADPTSKTVASTATTVDELPAAPEKAGYTFGGWFTEEEGAGDEFTASTEVTDDITVYAQWIADEHTLSFDKNGGTGDMNDVNLDTDEQTTLPANEFTRDGYYTFAGWATSTDGSVEYDDEDTYTMGTEDVTLYAVWEEYEPTVGDRGPAGGYIFYDDEEGYDFDGNGTIDSDEKDLLGVHRYLEAAPSGWYDGDEDPEFEWGYDDRTIATSEGIGTGKANTDAIKAQHYDWSYVEDYAAKACDDYSVTVNGTVYYDWFLPSKDELDLMYKNLHSQGKGDFSTVNYWSSSEFDIYRAHTQNFRNGYQSDDLYKESYNYSVRPVRRFAF